MCCWVQILPCHLHGRALHCPDHLGCLWCNWEHLKNDDVKEATLWDCLGGRIEAAVHKETYLIKTAGEWRWWLMRLNTQLNFTELFEKKQPALLGNRRWGGNGKMYLEFHIKIQIS